MSSIGIADGNRMIASISRFFIRPKWQVRLPDLLVGPSTNGKELSFAFDSVDF